MSEKRPPLDLIARASERLVNTTPEDVEAEQKLKQTPAETEARQSDVGGNTLSTSSLGPQVHQYEAEPDRVEIDLVDLQKQGYVTPNHQRSLIAEEFRIVKRPLLQRAFRVSDKPSTHNHVVMVTSAKPDEGKTFTSINLAMSVASERDLFVLLIDADIRRAELGERLGVQGRKGLMDVLVEPDLNVSDVMVRTNIPNLSILPAGIPRENATELFASKSMTDLVDDIAARYSDRFIIFDTPPVLASSEPSVLALHVGQVVMVVHANLTSRKAIVQSLPLLSGCPNINCVINNLSLAGTDRFGYYSAHG